MNRAKPDDVIDMVNEYNYARDPKDPQPTMLELGIMTYTELRDHPEIHKHLSFDHQLEFPVKICGLQVIKVYNRARYMKVC